MKNILFSLFVLTPLNAFSASDTSYECLSSKDERVLIEVLEGGLSMTVEGTGTIAGKIAERHVFPFLNPFLEVAAGTLRSLTHVAEMTSYYSQDEKANFLFPYVNLSLELRSPEPSRISWNILQFGGSNRFEVLCDKKGLWTTVHQTL